MAEVGQRQPPVARIDRAKRERGVGHQPGHAEAEGHVVVNADHIGAEALIDGDAGPCVPRAGARAGVTVIVGHERNLLSKSAAPARFPECAPDPHNMAAWPPSARAIPAGIGLGNITDW